MSKPLLIAMVGLPRLGKSTVSNILSEELNAPIVCRDSIRLALHGKRYEALAEPFVKAISSIMIRSLFLRGAKIVICDETNYSRAARDSIRSDADWRTVFFKVDTDVHTCVDRAKNTNQEDLVSVIWEMHGRYEALKPDEVLVYNQDELRHVP